MNQGRSWSELSILLAACTLAGWIASSGVILGSLEDESAWPVALIAIGCLAALPLVHVRIAGAMERLPAVGELSIPLAWMVQLLPLCLMPSPRATTFLFGGLILVHGHLNQSSDDDRNAAFCFSSAPLINVLALAVHPSAWLLGMLPLTTALAILTAHLGHARYARNCVRTVGYRSEAASPRPMRLLAAAPTAALVLILSAAVFLASEKVLEAASDEPAAVEQRTATSASPSGTRESGAPRNTVNRSPSSTPGSTAQGLAFGGGTSPFSDEVVLRVSPVEGTRVRQYLHLKHQVLDELTAEGARSRRQAYPPLWTDGEDETGVDGWTWLLFPDELAEYADFEITSRPLPVLDFGWTVLFSPASVAAVQMDRVVYHPDQLLAAPFVTEEEFTYRVRVLDNEPRLERIGEGHPGLLNLPPDGPALERLRREAERLVEGAASDLEKVRSIVDHFVYEYAYERTGDDFQGLESLVELLDRKSGYCTLFSGAAATMMRTQGIPTRLATGFIAHEWHPQEQQWIVRERDAHAWIEVYFEGDGWVPFDPTPPAGDGRGGGGFDPHARSSPAWIRDVSSAVKAWLDGETGSLAEVVASVLRAPIQAIWRNPTLLVVLSGLVLFALHLSRSDRGRVGSATTGALPRRNVDPTLHLQRRIIAALSRMGVVREKGETFSELAQRAAGANADLLDLPKAAGIIYRSRFGAQPLESEEKSRLETLALLIESTERRQTPRTAQPQGG